MIVSFVRILHSMSYTVFSSSGLAVIRASKCCLYVSGC